MVQLATICRPACWQSLSLCSGEEKRMENENGGGENVKTRWAGLSRSLWHTPSLTRFWLIFSKGKVSCLGLALTGSSPRRTLTRGLLVLERHSPRKAARAGGHQREFPSIISAESPRTTPAGTRPRFRFTSGHCTLPVPRPTARHVSPRFVSFVECYDCTRPR